MLKVWISGANGHLGQALCTRLDREKYQLIATDVAEVDVTVPAEVRAFADANRPDVIINCTGFNDEDGCETDPDRAYRVNALAVPNSFAEWMNATDYDFVITHPEGYELDPKFVGNARVEYDQMKAFEGADFVYAKNWAAYTGDNYGQILSKDRTWTVGERQMAVTNNAYFMHCLPVRRNMIVTDDVIESPQSIVIPEAANREISATVVLKRLLESL